MLAWLTILKNQNQLITAWNAQGLSKILVAINHSHPNNSGFSPADRAAYKYLKSRGFSELKEVYMFDGKGNHWYGSQRSTKFGFSTITHSCGGSSAASWVCTIF